VILENFINMRCALLAVLAATACLAPARSDVEDRLPENLRSKAWEEIDKSATDDKQRNRLFKGFYSRRTEKLREMFERAASPAEHEELRWALIQSADWGDSAEGMLVANGLADPEHQGITWPSESRNVALRRLRVIGPILDEDGHERHFTAWRVGHHHIEVVANDDHLLFDSKGEVLASHSTPSEVASHEDRPPCFLADGTVMTNDPVPGKNGGSRFRCIKDGGLRGEAPFFSWDGWRDYHAAYATDGLSLTLWSPGYRGAANGLLHIDGESQKVTVLPTDRIIELWPAGRGDSVRLSENNTFLPIPGHPGLSLVKWSTRHGQMVTHPIFSIYEVGPEDQEELGLVGADTKTFASVMWGEEFGTVGAKPLVWISARVPADGPYPYNHDFTWFPAPKSAHTGVWLFRIGLPQRQLQLMSWVAGHVVEPSGDPGEDVWLIDADQRIGVIGADFQWRDCLRFSDANQPLVRPYALFPSLKTGLFGIGEEMVFAGLE
jgi:hypothetical protein